MIYDYICSCGKKTEVSCKMGKAPKSVKCLCGKKAGRSFAFSVYISDPTHISREGRGKG